MLSDFVKKLEFVRQFTLSKGDVDILGVKELVLPVEVLELLNVGNKDVYKKLRTIFKNAFIIYLRKIGSSTPQEKLNNVMNLLNTVGIGDVEMDILDTGKRKAVIRVLNSSIVQIHMDHQEHSNTPVCFATAAIIAGAFSAFFNIDVDCQEVKCTITGNPDCTFIVKSAER